MAVPVAIARALVLAAVASAVQLPNTWPRCRRKDPNLDICLQHALEVTIPQLAAGVPELELPPLEGMHMQEGFTIQRRPGRLSLGMTVSNLYSHGLSTLKVHSVFTDLDNGIFDMYMTMPLSIMDADMEVEGSILAEPVTPQRGSANFTFYDIGGILVVSGRKVQREGETYLDIDYVRGQILNLGGLSLHFDPLDKNPQRSAKLNHLLNQNALAMWHDLRETLEKMHAEGFRKMAYNVFSKVPLKDIFLDDSHPDVLAGPSSVLLYGR